jgi:peptidylprolyl isomerase
MTTIALSASLASVTERPYVALDVQSRGRIVMELRPDQAPRLCAHFLDLIDKGFYDGLLFHRKVPGFVVQAGDPQSRSVASNWARRNPGERGGTRGLGRGGSGRPVPFEINDLTHDPYTVGMALESPMDDSGDSQFFINLAKNHRLNGLYVVFASVVEGRRIVDKIERGDRILRARRLPKPARRS